MPILEPYSILTIETDAVREDEAMGSKRKFWFRPAAEETDWLFKFPQTNTGQHWAEKIAAEIAQQLGFLHARVELADFNGLQGSATQSFARKGRELFHGNQVLAGQVLGYDPAKRFRQSSHTLDNIFSALDRVFLQPSSALTAKRRLASYLVLDALIGNTDRHHENWGILTKRTPNGRPGIIAPSFDHASSLGRELLDEGPGKCRARILSEDRLAAYAERAPGAIYWQEEDRRAISPLELVRRAAARDPALFRPSLAALHRIGPQTIEGIASRVPAGWMSHTARTFAVGLACYNLTQLKEIAV